MRFLIGQNFAVFSYELNERLVFVGSGQISHVTHFGKFCPTLDIEYRRLYAAGARPAIHVTILQMLAHPIEAEEFAANMVRTLKPTWDSEFYSVVDKARNPHIMHFGMNAVFPSVSAAATALGIPASQAYNMVNKPMFAGPKPGPEAKHWLISTDRPVTHDPRYMRGLELLEWRKKNGFYK